MYITRSLYSLSFFHFYPQILFRTSSKICYTPASRSPPFASLAFTILCKLRMMKTKVKAIKNMRGFMCQSPAATAVCMASEPLSVIVQRRPDRTFADHARLIDTTKYTRLAEARSRGLASATRRSATTVPSFRLNNEQEKASQSQLASSLVVKDQVFQVVVMRVSLHCQGCAGKVKKHLSKMEGVTSFSIDLESKRVTVMGHVSPMVVVESISKVKRAELWPSATC